MTSPGRKPRQGKPTERCNPQQPRGTCQESLAISDRRAWPRGPVLLKARKITARDSLQGSSRHRAAHTVPAARAKLHGDQLPWDSWELQDTEGTYSARCLIRETAPDSCHLPNSHWKAPKGMPGYTPSLKWPLQPCGWTEEPSNPDVIWTVGMGHTETFLPLQQSLGAMGNRPCHT